MIFLDYRNSNKNIYPSKLVDNLVNNLQSTISTDLNQINLTEQNNANILTNLLTTLASATQNKNFSIYLFIFYVL